VIVFDDVSLGYEGHCVISGLSFAVNAGDFLCVAGKNGSGKTTLIKAMLRLLPPMRGRITFDGVTRNSTGYVSQQSAAKKDFPAGAAEIVLSGMAGRMGARPFYSRKEKECAQENMERLGIAALKNRCFRELSGGQQRRVLIARALCAAGAGLGAPAPALLVLDEPAAGIDPAGTEELYALLKKLNGEAGMTIVMVSHDVKAAEQLAFNTLRLDAEEKND
jgi:zinc transport system ATP-binding protein